MFTDLRGVYAATITPLNGDFSIDFGGLPRLLEFLAGRGCAGALLFGTTGEGPSFAPAERLEALSVAADWRKSHPEFKLLAGVGTPSLTETIGLTQAAFALGYDGVVALPPYYFRTATDDGLFVWFSQVIQQAVPVGKAFFGYHFPNVSGVALSIDLLSRLKAAYPVQFAGLKDSSGDPDFASRLGERFGAELVVLTGSDRLFSLALAEQASGCITAMANLFSTALQQVWLAFQNGDTPAQQASQERLSAIRGILERYPPYPPALKALLARWHAFPDWPVRPPLLPLPGTMVEQLSAELAALG